MATTAERTLEAIEAGSRLRESYAVGTVRGTFLIELPTPRTIRALALAGFEFVVLDLEHSPFGIDALLPLIAEAHGTGLPVLVRVWTLDAGLVGKVLDLGANGVMVPHVSTAEQARAAVRAARYGPRGKRGLCPLIGYSVLPQPQVDLDGHTLVVVQVEGMEGVRNAAEMAGVDGIDALFIGPYDLSHAIGKPGHVDAPEVMEAAELVASRTPPDVMLGVYVDDPTWSHDWAERGFRLQCVGFDGRMLLDGARRVLRDAGGL